MTFAAFLASLAIAAGAPSSTTIVCNPELAPAGLLGLTYFAAPRVELAPRACAGALLLLASPAERRAIGRLNPRADLAELEAAGALTIAHEAAHARGIRSEANAEACGMKNAPAILASRLAGGELAVAARYVVDLDSRLPAGYRGGVCDPV
jgi:hypothetical protein